MSEQLRLEGGVTILCAIYTRLSKEDEDKQQPESESIQNQKSLLINYAVEHGWDIYHIYCDEDYSGADSLRPDFNKMIEAAKEKKFQIILCKSQSRFTRDMELVEKYIHGLFPVWGIRFIAVADNADTEIKGNKKARQINGLINEWYLEDLSENIRMVFDMKRRQESTLIERENIRMQTMEGRIQKAREGKWNGGFAPYGYKLEKGQLFINEEEAAAIRVIFDQYVHTDTGANGLAKYLATHGIHKIQRQSGKNHLFDAALIRRILKNPVYCGKIAYGRRRTERCMASGIITGWWNRTIICWWMGCMRESFPKNYGTRRRLSCWHKRRNTNTSTGARIPKFICCPVL